MSNLGFVRKGEDLLVHLFHVQMEMEIAFLCVTIGYIHHLASCLVLSCLALPCLVLSCLVRRAHTIFQAVSLDFDHLLMDRASDSGCEKTYKRGSHSICLGGDVMHGTVQYGKRSLGRRYSLLVRYSVVAKDDRDKITCKMHDSIDHAVRHKIELAPQTRYDTLCL